MREVEGPAATCSSPKTRIGIGPGSPPTPSTTTTSTRHGSAPARVSFSARTDPGELRRSGPYRVVTPEECVAIAATEGTLAFKPLVGGIDPDIGWEGLHLFADKVLPNLS